MRFPIEVLRAIGEEIRCIAAGEEPSGVFGWGVCLALLPLALAFHAVVT